MTALNIDLLAFLFITRSQSRKLMANLNKRHFYFTVIDSTSSLFHEPTLCLLLGLNHERIETLNKLVKKYCHPYQKLIPVQMHVTGEMSGLPVMEAQEGGAILYAIPVEYFEQI